MRNEAKIIGSSAARTSKTYRRPDMKLLRLADFWTATPGAGSGSDSPRIALPTRCTYVSHYEENNRSERGNYGFIGRDLISGKVPHILSANCRHRIGADFKCK